MGTTEILASLSCTTPPQTAARGHLLHLDGVWNRGEVHDAPRQMLPGGVSATHRCQMWGQNEDAFYDCQY